MLTNEDIDFIQLVLSRCPYTGNPQMLADYLQRYAGVMNKLDAIRPKKDEPKADPAPPWVGT